MKNLLIIYIILITAICSAQGIKKNYTASNGDYASVTDNNKSRNIYTSAPSKRVSGEAFKRMASKNKINSRTFYNLKGADEGYYIVSGVFSDLTNAKKLVQKLKEKGFAAGYISNADNGLNYVYLAQYASLDQAIDSCNSQLNGRYTEPFWLMNLDNGGVANKINPKDKTSTPVPSTPDVTETQTPLLETKPIINSLTRKSNSEQELSIDEVTYDMLNTVDEDTEKNSLYSKSISYLKEKDSPNVSRLIQKADEYFNKMWYAEAAELYELALADKNNYSYEVLKKAGDAYYFNTNMPKAFEWYDILYNEYKDNMTADNYFKYSHTLKGTGKYGKAKRLMRIYNRMDKQENTNLDANEETQSEVVLDNILGSKDKFKIKGVAVNTKYSDFSPMFYDNDKVVYASSKDSSFLNTRKYKWNDQPFLDLYVSKVNEESADLKESIKFSKKINTKYHEASVTFSKDNKTMYFTRNNYIKKLRRDKKGVNNLKIYKSVKIGDQWTEATELPFNNDEYSTGHPALSPDGKLLYFVSDMPGTLGGSDIFVVDVLENGNYSDPRNLGPGINTEKREMFPFVTDKKLYFSSDGHDGLGGLDVYEVAYDEEGFKEIKNVGKPINSNKDDFSYIISEENQKGYFASNREGGKGDDDIYSFERLQLEEVTSSAIAGVVSELVTGEFMPRAMVMLLDENNIKLREIETSEDGSFVFEDLKGDKKYIIRTNKEGYFVDAQNVVTIVDETTQLDVSLKRLEELIAIEDGIKKLKTDMIYFNFDKSFIRDDAASELDKLVAVMKEYPNMVIKIESHTDSRGSKDYNRYLSDKRAKSTRDYIVSKGIDINRIESAIGYGEDKLLNGCDGSVRCTSAQHELNRRSEFIIVSM